MADEFVQQHARDHVERLEDAFATVRARREGRHLDFAIIQQELLNDLAGHGIKLEFGFETFNRHRLDGKEVEKQRAV